MSGGVDEFYTNDIVFRYDKRRKRIVFGIVTESYEASSDITDCDMLEKGQIRVCWFISDREHVWNQNKVRLMNRSILPGDIVRRFVHGQDTQRGYCKVAKQLVTVQIVGTDKVVEAVCSSRLRPVAKFMYDKIVCFDNKYGRIDNIYFNITMQTKCGSSVDLKHYSGNNGGLDDYWLSKRNRWYSGVYYPGQEIVCIPLFLTGANWTHRSKTMKRRMQSRMRFTIQTVEVESVEIYWLNAFESNSGSKKHCVKGPDIQKIKVFDKGDQHSLDLAERLLLRLSSSDKLMKKQDWLHKQTKFYNLDVHKVTSRRVNRFRRNSSTTYLLQQPPATISDNEEWLTDDGDGYDNESSSNTSASNSDQKKKRHFPPHSKEIVPGNTLAVEILCYESKITVVWQDGSVEEDIPSTQLCYSVSLDDHEFFPGEWVVMGDIKNSDQYGSVESVNHLERTAKVRWFHVYDKDMTKTNPIDLHTNELSVYDLHKHKKFQFRPGSVVYPADGNASKVGLVLDSYPEGYVNVRWMEGGEAKSWPQDLKLLLDLDYDIMSDSSSEGPGSWETESIVSMEGDNVHDENTLTLLACKLDYVRMKLVNLKEIFKTYPSYNTVSYLTEFLIIYDNSSYLDKLLGTSFFSRKSRHFMIILEKVKERARAMGITLSGRLFSSEPQHNIKMKVAEKENVDKVRNIESDLNEQISKSLSTDSMSASDGAETTASNEVLCVELLTMLKVRLDLAYAEIISRIGAQDALTVMTKASESTPIPSVLNTPDEILMNSSISERIFSHGEGYAVLDEASKTHHFYSKKTGPINPKSFYKAIQREVKLLDESLPSGVWVRSFSDRMDLLSVMIRGPSKTPYEDGLFLFDIQLSPDYPLSPPLVHYISYSSERLNPNLYVEGKVCVSLLGTWMGKGSEKWTPSSSLLQVIVSIQGLILVSEPYYNEAGYEKQVESQQGNENSRTYNELVVLKLVQAMTVLLLSPPSVFRTEILTHFAECGASFIERIEKWTSKTEPYCPDFSLLPVSKGFLLSLQCALEPFKDVCSKAVAEFRLIQNLNQN